MADLLTLTREHDLPPKWDGHPVEWGEWSPAPHIICPAVPPDKCVSCGSTKDKLTCHGTLLVSLVQPGVARIGRGRLREHEKRAMYAMRCPDCSHDSVWDTWTDQWWDLDHTDYGPEGSHDPSEH